MTYTTLSVREDTKAAFEEIRQGTDLSQSDLLERLVEERELSRLRDDQRIRETIEAIANDHDVPPEEVSLKCAFKVAAGAYNGYQQTSDWLEGETA